MLYPEIVNLPYLMLGYDWDYSFIYKESGTAVDVSEYSASFKVMDAYDSSLLDTWTSAASDITLGEDGSVAIAIASDDQSNLSVGKKKYIVELTDGDSVVSVVRTGDFPIVDINGS